MTTNERSENNAAVRPPLSKRATTLLAATVRKTPTKAESACGVGHLLSEVDKSRDAAFVWINRARREGRS